MKTKCKCKICGFEINGNSKWETERDMWENHVKIKHPKETLLFDEGTKIIRNQIAELEKKLPSLYSVEQRGKVKDGGWTF